MHTCLTRLSPVARVALALPLLASVWPSANAGGPGEVAANPDAVQVVLAKNAERLIHALSTTNHAPKLVQSAEFTYPLFPKDFDWKEYSRVHAAINDLDANSEAAWPTIVEHMSDTGFCFTVQFCGSALNYSRGDVCARIAQTWIRSGYAGLMPGGTSQHFRLPVDGPKALQQWCRARRGKSFAEIQIDAAEWAVSTIQKEKRVPPEILAKYVVAIRERVANLRERIGRRHAEFFVPDVVCWYGEEVAERFREQAGEK
jgi:hypothetical protein